MPHIWTDEIACRAHWFSLNSLSNRITSQSNSKDRIEEALTAIQEARTLYRRVRHQGISFDPLTGPDHIDEWRNETSVRCGLTVPTS